MIRKKILLVPYIERQRPYSALGALTMTLQYLGRGVERLEAEAPINLSELRRLAEREGFGITRKKHTLAEIITSVDQNKPLIIGRKTHDHPIGTVVVGYDPANGKVLVHDPELGPYLGVSYSHFKRSWRPYALSLNERASLSPSISLSLSTRRELR